MTRWIGISLSKDTTRDHPRMCGWRTWVVRECLPEPKRTKNALYLLMEFTYTDRDSGMQSINALVNANYHACLLGVGDLNYPHRYKRL